MNEKKKDEIITNHCEHCNFKKHQDITVQFILKKAYEEDYNVPVTVFVTLQHLSRLMFTCFRVPTAVTEWNWLWLLSKTIK